MLNDFHTCTTNVNCEIYHNFSKMAHERGFTMWIFLCDDATKQFFKTQFETIHGKEWNLFPLYLETQPRTIANIHGHGDCALVYPPPKNTHSVWILHLKKVQVILIQQSCKSKVYIIET